MTGEQEAPAAVDEIDDVDALFDQGPPTYEQPTTAAAATAKAGSEQPIHAAIDVEALLNDGMSQSDKSGDEPEDRPLTAEELAAYAEDPDDV